MSDSGHFLIADSSGISIVDLMTGGWTASFSGSFQMPAWSWDYSLIIAASTTNGPLVVINPAAGTVSPVPNTVGALSPAYSRDGKVSFVGPASGGAAAFILPAIGATPVQVTAAVPYNMAPMIDPGGQYLSYTKKDAAGHNEIWIKNLSDGSERQLTFSTFDPTAPDANGSCWSPDSSMIAFFSGVEGNQPSQGNQNISLVNFDGSNRRQITQCHPNLDGSGCQAIDGPRFRYDGAEIACDRGATNYPTGPGTWTFAVNLDGSNLHPLLQQDYGGGQHPWGP